jgi:ABC-2 type transport system ATP-binding protein
MVILKVDNLTKTFGRFTAVDHISFELKEGEILGYLGPNGAGKTTTIQMLLGVLTPTSGEVSYFGKSLFKHHEKIMEQINFSSTYNDLPHRLTVKEIMIYTSFLYQIDNRSERSQKIRQIFHLGNLWYKQIKELSAGQKTRVGLAKALINYPKILLLDEPTASLDPDVATYIRKFLLTQQEKFQVSILITSHNMAEIEELCDRVIFLNKGRIIADDTPINLAKTISISHVSLMITDGMKRTQEICQQQQLSFTVEGRYITINLKEKQIPYFLKDILEKGIEYSEISIDKPTIEDYFLQVAEKR